MNVLEVVDLYRFYHIDESETRALRGVSLTVAEGEMVAIHGPSGSGKSTLLACVTGIDTPDGGHVNVMGTQISRKPELFRSEIRARYMGILLQSGNLFEHLSVEENMMLQMHILGQHIDLERIDELLTVVNLQHRREATSSRISGGEAARAGIAVALAAGPKILIADEPTGEVDRDTEESMIDLFEQFVRRGGSMLVATHSKSLARRADRSIAIEDGRVKEDA